MKNIYLIIILLLPLLALAQDEENEYYEDDNSRLIQKDLNLKIEGGIYFNSSIPIGALKEKMTPGFGLGLTGVFSPYKLPVGFGFDVGMFWYDRVTSDIFVFNGEYDEAFTYHTTASIYTFDFIARYEHDFDLPIYPYVDAIIGCNRLVTWTRQDDEFENDNDFYSTYYDDLINSQREQGDWTYAIGGKVGLKFQVAQYLDHFEKIHVDLSLSYRKGGIGKYMVKKDAYTIQDSPADAFEEKFSSTDLLIARIGVLFEF